MPDLGFVNVPHEHVKSDLPKNQVIDQSVKRGTKVDVTTRIVLTISLGGKEDEEVKQEVTKTVTIDLPRDRTEEYTVELHHNGKVVMEAKTVSPEDTSFTVTLTGSGTQHFDLYINDGYYKTIKVEFS